jgi:hypothetical protein
MPLRPPIYDEGAFAARTQELLGQLIGAGKVDPDQVKRFATSQSWNVNLVIGQWAEGILAAAFADAGLAVYKYGADEQGELTRQLKAFYTTEYAQIGKRPDLLVLPPGAGESIENGRFAVEVRSSAREGNAAYGLWNDGKQLSMTIKVEDILPQSRWVMATGVPLFVAQVFELPEAYAINWNHILEHCLQMRPKKVPKSGKETYFIPLDAEGVVEIGEPVTLEEWEARLEMAPDGKRTPYAAPLGTGRLAIDEEAYYELMNWAGLRA